MSNTKQCPFCAEEIDISAETCTFCGEPLENSSTIDAPLKIKTSLYGSTGWRNFSFCGKLLKLYWFISCVLFCTQCYTLSLFVSLLVIVIVISVIFAFVDKCDIDIDRKSKSFSCSGTMYYARDIFEYLSIFYWFSDFKRIRIDLSTLTGINTYKLGNKYFIELSDGINHYRLRVENEAVLREITICLQEIVPDLKKESRISGTNLSICYTTKVCYIAVVACWLLYSYNILFSTSYWRPEWLKNSNELVKLRVDCANEIKAEFARDEKLRKWKIFDVRLVKDEKVENMYSGQLYLEYKGYAPVLSVMVIVPDDGSKFTWTLQAQELQQLKERYIY